MSWSALLLACCVINFWQASRLELINDEAYYWMFSRFPDWGYYDHPPMVAWWIDIGSWIGGELGVRLASLIFWTFGGWIFVCLARPAPPIAAVLWYFLLPLTSAIGFLAVPDAPLSFFTIAFLYALDWYLRDDSALPVAATAVAAAGLLYSKYHGLLIVGAAVLSNLRLLRTWRFWACALLGLALFLPHLYWQWSHGFVSVAYHLFDRVRDYRFAWWRAGAFMGIQLILPGLLLGPWAWIQFGRTTALTEYERTLKAIALVTVGFFLLAVMRTKVEANWTIAAYPALALFLLRRNIHPLAGRLPALLTGFSLVLMLLFRVLVTYPPDDFPKRGLPAQVHGWKAWVHTLEREYPNCRWTANGYQLASKLSFYSGTLVPSLNIHGRSNQFDLWKLDEVYRGQDVCHLDDKQLLPGEALRTPDGRAVTLVRGVSLETWQKFKHQS